MSRAKGNRTQLKLIKELEEDGWRTAKLEQKGKFTKETDAFGLFDILSIQELHRPRLIQVTTNRPHGHSEFLNFAKTYGVFLSIYQYVWYDRRGWVIFEYSKKGMEKTDLRKVLKMNKGKKKI